MSSTGYGGGSDSASELAKQVNKISIDGNARDVPPANIMKKALRETIAYFGKPETERHLREAAKPSKGPASFNLAQQVALKLAGKVLEAHGVPSQHGWAVMRQVTAGNIYPEDAELRGLIQKSAETISMTCRKAMFSPNAFRKMQAVNMQMSQMQSQIVKRLAKMTEQQRQKVWEKTQPRAMKIMQKMNKLTSNEEKIKYQSKMSPNDKEALMLYQILVSQRQQNMAASIQKASMKQVQIAKAVQARVKDLNDDQKKARLNEISVVAQGIIDKMCKMPHAEQMKYQNSMSEDDSMLLAEYQVLLSSVGEISTKPLRFKVGARVLCNVGTSWQKGTIVRLNVHGGKTPTVKKDKGGRTMPYQIKLDVGQFILAPMDIDVVIRSMPVGAEDPKSTLMASVMAVLSAWTVPEKKERLAELRESGVETRIEAIKSMPKDVQKRCQEGMSVDELRETIEFRFLVRMEQAGFKSANRGGMTSGQLRFGVGQRVACNYNNMTWKGGVIVKTHYREPNWPRGRVAPYQIRLDDGNFIYAPMDHDNVIRAEGGKITHSGARSTTKEACCPDHGKKDACCEKKHDHKHEHNHKNTSEDYDGFSL